MDEELKKIVDKDHQMIGWLLQDINFIKDELDDLKAYIREQRREKNETSES